MSLRDVLAQLDIEVRGAAALRTANGQVDAFGSSASAASTRAEQFRIQQLRASETASRLAGQIRLLQRAEGDNTAQIEELRLAYVRAQQAATTFGQAAAEAAAPPPSRWETFTTGLTNASHGLNVARAAFYAIEGVGEAVAGEFRQVIEAGDELGDTAVRLNTSAQALQEWRFVAESTGTSTDAVDRGLQSMGRTLANSHGEQNFRRLGVATREAGGAFRSQGDIFADTVAAIARMPQGLAQATAAQRAFGRSGQELLPLIRSAPGDIDRLRGRFRELGGGLSDDVVNNAGKTDQAMREFGVATDGARATIANAFLPTIANGITTIAGFIGKMRQAWDTSSAGVVAFGALRVAAIALGIPLLALASPLIILALLGGAAILVVEDLVTAFRGGRSVIGSFWHGFEANGLEAIEGVLGAVRELQGWLGIEEGSGVGVSAEAFAAVQAAAGRARARTVADDAATAAAEGSEGSAPEASAGAGAETAATTASAPAPQRGALRSTAERGGRGDTHVTVDASGDITVNGVTDADGVVRAIRQDRTARLREAADTFARTRATGTTG